MRVEDRIRQHLLFFAYVDLQSNACLIEPLHVLRYERTV